MAIADQIADTLRREIIGNVLKPGSPLSENLLASRFNTSRTPVREATLKLANEHLVNIVPGRGAFISTMDLGQVEAVYEVRLALEPLAAKSAFGMLQAAELEHLKGKWIDLQKRVSGGNQDVYDEIAKLDHETHLCFTRKTANSWLRHFLALLEVHISRMRNLSIIGLGEAEETIRQHLALIALAESKDLDAFLTALTDHIVFSAAHLRSNIDLS